MKEYPINFIIQNRENSQGYFVGTFEDTEDPEIEWPHRHSFYSIVLFTVGSGINVIDFSEYEILPNRLFTINPKQIHNWNYSENSRGYILNFEAHLAKELDIEFASSFIDIPDSDKSFFNKVFEKLIFESRQNDHLGKKNNRTGISYLCSLINRFTSSPKATNLILTNFKNLICQNFSETQTIEYYAKCLHTSTVKLNTCCKMYIGITAKQFQLDLKITEAKRLLIYSSLNTSEIAYQTGFEDISYFSRIFKKKTGLSPTNFKEKYLNNG
jgi:AraC-like DNA-binding protein